MQLQCVGKIEEETHLTDLDQLERKLEREIVETVLNDNAPRQSSVVSSFFQPAPYRPAYVSAGFSGGKVKSKFMQTDEKAEIQGVPLHPLSYFQKRQRLVANNDAGRLSKFMPLAVRRHVTVDALVALGAVPLRLLAGLGHFRYAKQRRFNSALRLVQGLEQGHEDAEQFLRDHPAALRKKGTTAFFGA